MKPHYSNTNNPIDFPKSKNKMNERIKLLAIQADWDDEFREDFDIKKFAELIVKECGQIAYSEENDYGNKIRFMILEHFGVE